MSGKVPVRVTACSADRDQDWQPSYPFDPYSAIICDDHNRYIHTVQVFCWFGEAVSLFHIQPGSEYYKRQFCTSKAAGVGPRCIVTRSLAAGLGHRWSSQEGRGVNPAFYSSYSYADGEPAGP